MQLIEIQPQVVLLEVGIEKICLICVVYHIREGGWDIIEDGQDVNKLHWEYTSKESKF
jgi:hypothetical protein